jgi:3-oxoacyl-[acyl-carrier-protein] synthase II
MQCVVVTGCGVVSPLGLSTQETWQGVINGRSGVGPITLFDTGKFAVQMAAEVKNFDPAKLLDRKAARRQDRFEQLANVAADEAFNQSGLTVDETNSYRIGQSISSAFGGIISMIDQITLLNAEGSERVHPLGLTRFMTTSPSISIKHGLQGPSFSVASACASGADGIGLAFQLIRAGIVDAMVAGGADAAVASLAVALFDQMRAYSHHTDRTPSPFSADRDGIIVGEGAGVMVLESLSHALKRGANILAELVGYGATTDAFHLTAPSEDGKPGAEAIRRALDDAQLNPEDLHYINAHGTGTTLNDLSETQAIKHALGETAYDVPISSTKSMTGHMMAAAGAVESILCVQAIREGVIPPTINYAEPDPDCDLDYVPNESREIPVKAAATNSFGFGGHNVVLVFRAFDG